MRVAMIGASGLVGRSLVALLARHDRVLVGRRALDIDVPQRVGPIETWPQLVEAPLDVAVSTLGTTRAAAGSEGAFRAVDFDAVLGFARAAGQAGARQFITVSSVGASPTSSTFYLRVKGEVEDALRSLGFARLDIVRPGLLRGDRGGERRLGEHLAIVASPLTDRLLPASLSRYRSIAASDVAKAIAALVGASREGAFVHHNADLLERARR